MIRGKQYVHELLSLPSCLSLLGLMFGVMVLRDGLRFYNLKKHTHTQCRQSDQRGHNACKLVGQQAEFAMTRFLYCCIFAVRLCASTVKNNVFSNSGAANLAVGSRSGIRYTKQATAASRNAITQVRY